MNDDQTETAGVLAHRDGLWNGEGEGDGEGESGEGGGIQERGNEKVMACY